MSWLKQLPQRPPSIRATLCEIKQSVEALKRKRQSVMDNEVSLEYPRETRVEMYRNQLATLDNVRNQLDNTINEIDKYPNQEEKEEW